MITASAVNTKMLNPNFALMCSPGASPDSFADTAPFGFNSATYFLPMCTLLGVAVASVFIGGLSDKFGRKIFLLVLGWVSAVGSVVKCEYTNFPFALHIFCTFYVTNLYNTLFRPLSWHVLGLLHQQLHLRVLPR